VQLEHAADTAVRAHGLGDLLLLLVPGARLPHVVLALEHQRPGRTDADAVATVDAGRLGKLDGELRRYVRIEAPAGDAYCESVLRVDTAGLDALVAEDAARVITHVEVVVHLDRLRYRCRRRSEALWLRTISRHPSMDLGRAKRHVDRRREQLQYEPAAVLHALGVGMDLHAGLDFARARRNQDS